MFNTLGKQKVLIYINNTLLYKKTISGQDINLTIPFSSSILKDSQQNTIKFVLPDAHTPGTKDSRVLAIAIKSFSVCLGM